MRNKEKEEKGALGDIKVDIDEMATKIDEAKKQGMNSNYEFFKFFY